MKTLVTKGARLLAVLPLLVLFAGTSTFAQVPVSLPDLDTTPGETVTAPVEVGDVSGEDIQSFEFTVTYDPSLVEVTASPSGLSASDNVAEFRANNPSEGELRVAVTSGADGPLDGSGSLAELEVTAASDVAGTTDLTFESFQFNEGTPSATLSGGSVEVKDIFVSLPDIVAQSGDEVEIDIETTDLTGLGARSFTFDLPYDPSVLSNVEIVQEGTLSEGIDLQSTIDQDGGSVTVAAAAGTDPLEGSGTLLTIQGTLSSGSTPLEFSSFQFEEGRISAGTSAGSVSVADVIASLPEFPAAVGTSQTFSVRTTDLTAGMDVFSYEFSFVFDPDVLEITGIETEGTLSEGVESPPTFNVEGDSVSVAVASDSPLEGSGALIRIQADVVGAGESPLEFRSFQFNETPPTVATVNGLITATAESSSAQFIHNAADPGASPVDIYFGDAKVLDDFEFRTATPFLDVPADTEFEVGVAPGGSSGPGDIIASFPNSFAADTSHTVVANGVLDPGNFAENPDGEDIGFELFVETGAEQSAPDGQVGLRAVHGATDAPTVDIDENGTTLFDNLTYGDVTPDYLDAAAEMKRLVVTPGESEESVAAFQADLSGLGGSAATVLASGFLDPAANQDGPAFALVAALPNGDVVIFEANQAPQFTEVPGDTSVSVNEDLAVTISAEDPDGDAITFSLSQAPDNASIDSESGEFSFTPTPQQRNSTFDVGVQASDGQATADTAFAVDVQPIQRDPIAVDIDRAFGDATDDTNYLLVGLPGQVDLPIENTLSGDPGESNDWRAFWDDGSSAFEDGLVEFDGSSTFNFQAGRGFWVLSRNNWTVSQEFQPVPLDDNANASIDLHSGWNIISNPLGKDVSLSAIQAVNDISQPVWSFSGSFDQSSTFASAQSGQAYYFLNEGGQLDELQIPFFEPSGSGAAVASKKKKNGETLQLDALVDDDEASSVWVGTQPNAKEGRDKFDSFSPPGYFTDATLSVANSEIESPHALASDVRPAGTDGHTYNLVLETGDTDGRLTLRASGVSDLDADTEVRLYNQANGRSVDLRTNQSVDVKAPGEQTEFTLLVGKASYVQQQASEFAPEELEFRQNYPNPFQAQGQTTLEYSLPEQTEVTVGVYDVLGRRVLTLVDGKSQRAGVHTLQWDGRTGEGQTVASGVYFARLEASQTRTIRMVVID